MCFTKMRSPICTILGNVDSGKTSLLDKLRQTNLQSKEAGGITQKMGVTHFSNERIADITKGINKPVNIPGIMFIDTPGHQCFTNQRMCGVNISDLVIVVVDIFKGIEKQTMECIELLKSTKTPFIVAANKMDRIYGWKEPPIHKRDKPIHLKQTFKNQSKKVNKEIDRLLNDVELSFATNGLNARRYFKNQNMKEFISIVPMSAKTGDGVPDLLALINMLTSKFFKKKLTISTEFTSGIFLESVKDIKTGELISSIVTNGQLQTSHKVIFIDGKNEVSEAIVKQIYQGTIKTSTLDASNDCKIRFKNNQSVKTGSRFFVFSSNEDRTKYHSLLEKDIENDKMTLDLEYDKVGLFLNAPTVGMGIALYNLCKSKNYKVAGINVGEVKKVHIMKTATANLNPIDKDDEIYNKRHSTILAYDVDVSKELAEFAKNSNVFILQGDIIYHLVDEYTRRVDELDNLIKERHKSILPSCNLSIIEQFVFIKRNPIIMGVKVKNNPLQSGMLLETTSLKGDKIILGKVVSIQKDKKELDEGEVGSEVCIKIMPNSDNDKKYEYGKDFDASNELSTYYTTDDKQLLRIYPDVFSKN